MVTRRVTTGCDIDSVEETMGSQCCQERLEREECKAAWRAVLRKLGRLRTPEACLANHQGCSLHLVDDRAACPVVGQVAPGDGLNLKIN